MKKTGIVALLLITISLPFNFGQIYASVIESTNTTVTTEKIANVTGIVTLKVMRKRFPENLIDLFAGTDSKLMKQKKISVTGEYNGGSVVNMVSVEADGKNSEYSFEFPILASIMTSTSTKLISEITRFQSVQMTFTNSNDVPDVIDEATNKFEAKKVTNKRLGQAGILQGSFAEAGAKGRFLLKLDFNIEE